MNISYWKDNIQRGTNLGNDFKQAYVSHSLVGGSISIFSFSLDLADAGKLWFLI